MTTTIVQNSFLPTQIPGCKLWVDGADPAGTGIAPANASTVSTWKDKSGLANNATSAGSAVTYSSASAMLRMQAFSLRAYSEHQMPVSL